MRPTESFPSNEGQDDYIKLQSLIVEAAQNNTDGKIPIDIENQIKEVQKGVSKLLETGEEINLDKSPLFGIIEYAPLRREVRKQIKKELKELQ